MDSLVALRLDIEALIFASEQGIRVKEICQLLEQHYAQSVLREEVEEQIEVIRAHYAESETVFELVEIGEGYQFLTKSAFHGLIQQLDAYRSKKKLSQAALETLAIIAYKQPITKGEIEQIRGVNCDYSIQRLLEKELIHIAGKSDSVGRPLLYGTSELFMDYFGIKHPKDLPQLKEILPASNEIGEETS
jgi:segregation and condensation protein B